jgi:hypothetical protein
MGRTCAYMERGPSSSSSSSDAQGLRTIPRVGVVKRCNREMQGKK